MTQINQDVLNKISAQTSDLLQDHRVEMEEAFLQSEADKLVVSIAATVEPAKTPGTLKVKTTIAFVKKKVKDESVDYVNTNQLSFLDEKET